LTVAVAFALAKRLFSSKAGLITILVLALSPLAIFYAREVRMYSLLGLFVALAFYFLERAIEPGPVARKRWFGLTALAVALALYTHYYALLALAGVALFAFGWTAVRREWRLFGSVLGTFGAAGILFLPWLPTFLAQFGSNPVAWIPETTADRVSMIIFRFFLNREMFGGGYPIVVGLLIVGLVSGLYLFVRKNRQAEGSGLTFGLLFVFCAAVLPVLLAVIVSLFKPLIVARYFVPVLAPASILLAVGMMGLWQERRLRIIAPLLVMALAITAFGELTAVLKLDWSGAANYLEANSSPDDVLLVGPTNNDAVLRHYFRGNLEKIVNVTVAPDFPAIFEGVADAKRVWVATVQPDPSGVNGQLTAYIEDRLNLVSCQIVGEDDFLIDMCLYLTVQ